MIPHLSVHIIEIKLTIMRYENNNRTKHNKIERIFDGFYGIQQNQMKV